MTITFTTKTLSAHTNNDLIVCDYGYDSGAFFTENVRVVTDDSSSYKVQLESRRFVNLSDSKKYYTLTRPDGSTYNGSVSASELVPIGSTGELSHSSWVWSGSKTHAEQTITKTWTMQFYTTSARTTKYGGLLSFRVVFKVSAKPSYSVSYNGNGSTSGSTAAQTKWYGETLALRSNGYTRTNHVFKNWNTNSAGTGTPYTAGANYTANAAVTLYAQWYAPYTITPNANGGTLASGCGNLVKVYNTARTLWAASLNPTRTNYSFGGWNTNSSGTGTNYAAGESYTANANATLYAKWTQVYASPQLTVSKVYRCDSSGDPADEGTCAAVECSLKIWRTDATNTCSVTMKVREAGTTGEWTTVSASPTLTNPSGSTWREANAVKLIATTANLDVDKQYDIEVSVTDTQGGGTGRSSATTTKSATITTAFYIIDVLAGGHGICFGGVAKNEVFLVNMPSTFTGRADKRAAAGSPTRADGAPTDDVNLFTEHYYDSAGVSIGYSSVVKNKNSNNMYRSLAVRNQTQTGTEVTAALYVTAGRDGSRAVSLASGMTWPVAYGGTGITNFGAFYYVNGSNVSVANNPSSYPKLASVTLQPGKWLVMVGCYAAYAANGARMFTMSTASSVTGAAGRGVSVQVNSAAATCYVPMAWALNVTTETTYNVFGWQNSGSALNMSACINYVRIG